MEQREGLLEFRLKITTATNNRGRVVTKSTLQYRQCFGGIWEDWKDVPIPSRIVE